MKHKQPKYNPVLSDIYSRAKKEYQLYNQWLGVSRIGYLQIATEHLIKTSALIELLESVTVFNIGGGYYQQFNTSIKDRLDSFQHLSD